MDLNLSAEQRELRDTARQFLADNFDRGDQLSRTNGGFDHRANYPSMAALGWTGLTIPDGYGGAGGSLLDLAVVVEETGRAGAVTPLIVNAAYGAMALMASANPRSRQELLDRITNGSAIVTLGNEGGRLGRGEWAAKHFAGQRGSSEWVFSGRSPLVPFAHEADLLLIAVDLEGRGPSLVLTPTSRPGIAASRQQVIGGEPRYAVVFERVRLVESDVLDLGDADPRDVMDHISDVASLMYVAEAVGAAEAALQLAVAHAKIRVQFGKPIGAFQAVSNRCADMRLGIDGARLLCWEAVWSVDERKSYATERVAVAKSYMNSVAQTVITNALQVHGGIGYSTEYPLHLYIRLLKAFQLNFGASRDTLATVATCLGI